MGSQTWCGIIVFLMIVPGCFLKTLCSQALETECPNVYYHNLTGEVTYFYRSTGGVSPPLHDLGITRLVNITCTNVSFAEGPLGVRDLEEDECTSCDGIITISSSVIPTIPSSVFRKFPSTTILFITDVQLETILPGAFNSLNSLKELYLSDNNLTIISDGIFNSLVVLDILDLSRNNISNLSTHSLAGTNLETLNLSSNILKIFNSEIFNHLTKIDVLDLSFNNLYKFNFIQMEKIKFLNLSNNYINEVHGCFTMLMTLNLSKNQINSLENFTCHSAPSNIIELDLSFNSLSTLDPEIFSSLNKLKYLFLQNNKIASISNGCFSILRSLHCLNLSSNSLERIQYGLFDNLYNLIILDISNNKLSFLKKSTYHSLRNLQKLYFQNNKISYVNSEDLINCLPNLTRVTLDDNNFTCESLIEIFYNLKSIALTGKTFNTMNIYGIRCFEEEFLNSPDNVNTDIGQLNHSESTYDFQGSSMYSYFNKDFKNSNFFKYLESLQANSRPDANNDGLYNYLNNDFEKSNFYKYLEVMKTPKVIKYSENGNSTKTEELTGNFQEGINMDSTVLIVIMTLLVLIVCLLALFLFILHGKRNKLNNHIEFRDDEVVELLES